MDILSWRNPGVALVPTIFNHGPSLYWKSAAMSSASPGFVSLYAVSAHMTSHFCFNQLFQTLYEPF